MKTFIAVALVASASAAVLPRADQCCFQLAASGGQSGQVGQLDDGQNRVGGSYPTGTYCLSDGTITDGNGRGCILTPPTTQFQCDKGATPDSGFSVGDNGELLHNGDSTFFACAADSGEYNIYTETSDDQTKCVEISLSTSGECKDNGNGASFMSATKPASSPTGYTSVMTSTAYTCPEQSTVTATQYKTEYKTKQVVSTATATEYKTSTATETAYKTSTATATEYKTEYDTATATEYKTEQDVNTVTATEYKTEYKTEYSTVSDCSATSAYNSPTGTWGYPASSETEMASTAYTNKPTTSTEMASTGYTQQPATESAPASTAAASACQTSLVPGSYETPHLMVPISSGSPDESYGTSYNASANGDMSTVFNFDIPQSDEGKTCSLVFLFPKKEDLETTDYTWNGKGSLDFAMLSGAADESITYNSCPSKERDLGSVMPEAGGSYVVQSGPCAAGTTESIQMMASGRMDLTFFEDWNPSPLGLFITVC